ncbi:MAG: DUF1822 family protein [Brachyspira sp.]|nr:DUF1822 family protein [Brachyspira sp.]
MGMEQETLIYIEENDKKEARILTQSFANAETKSRAYINALGAGLGMKYLALENINNGKTYNLHSIHKILEEMDISDIMLSNIHIDVRVIFDENLIFIPKSHFEYDILPDIYLVLNLSEDHAHAKFLGFFEPKLINKNNQNDNYYFIEKEKLSAPVNLKQYIENFKGNTTSSLSSEENENAEILMVSLMDQNVSKNEMKELLKYLAKSAELRDKFIELENFETLSYKSLHTEGVTMPKDVEEETPLDATLDDFENLNETDLLSSDEENQNEQTMEESTEENQEAANELEDLNSVNDIGDIGDINDLDGLGDIDSSDLTGAEEEVTTEADIQNPDDSSIANGLSNLATLAETAAAGAVLENAAEAAVTDVAINAVESVAETGFDILSDTVENLSAEISPEALPENTADMTLGEADLPDLNSDLSSIEDITATNESAGLMPVDESGSIDNETQDFSTIETVEVPQAMPQEVDSEMEVLDISNVNAVPNNLDANISETIEFNNIEQADNEPCSNELNIETTAPTVSIDNIDSFNGLEPLNPEDMTYPDNSVDIENLSVASMDTMQPINSMPVNDEGMDPFAAVDLDSISLVDSIPQNNGANIQKKNEEIANSIDEDALNSSLDEIPDFGNELGMGLDSLDEIPDLGSDAVPPVQQAEPQQDAIVSDNIMPAQNESSQISDKAIESLTVDDIIEAPQEDLAQMSEIPEDTVAENVQYDAQEVSSMSEIPDENPEFTAIAGLDDLTDEDTVEEMSESSPEDTDDNQDYETEEDPELRMLFNENADTQLSNTEQIQTLESPFLNRQPAKSQNSLKKVLVAVIAAVLLGGTFFLFTMKNRNNPAELESLAQNEPETEIPAEAPAATATDAPAATDNSDILANTPAVETIPAAQSEPKNTKEVKPAASAAKGTKPINPPGTYMSVKKLSWEVPDYLSYSNNINKYLQTAGKSIKLSLSSDLLLTNEYAYSNQVKVSMKLSNDGTLKDIQLVKSSGSDQINKIVLQTVKDTLNVIKPATGEVPAPEFKLGLTINF